MAEGETEEAEIAAVGAVMVAVATEEEAMEAAATAAAEKVMEEVAGEAVAVEAVVTEAAGKDMEAAIVAAAVMVREAALQEEKVTAVGEQAATLPVEEVPAQTEHTRMNYSSQDEKGTTYIASLTAVQAAPVYNSADH